VTERTAARAQSAAKLYDGPLLSRRLCRTPSRTGHNPDDPGTTKAPTGMSKLCDKDSWKLLESRSRTIAVHQAERQTPGGNPTTLK